MSTSVSICLADILNDGKPGVVEKSARVSPGDSVKGADSRSVTVTSVSPSSVSVTEAQAYLTGTVSGDCDTVTIAVSANAVLCTINCNLRIKMPDGNHKSFDPLIDVIPR